MKKRRGLVALPAVVQDFFEDLRRRGRVRMASFRQPLRELVDDVYRFLMRDLRAAGHQEILALGDPGLAVAARVGADHEMPPLVLLGSHGLILTRLPPESIPLQKAFPRVVLG